MICKAVYMHSSNRLVIHHMKCMAYTANKLMDKYKINIWNLKTLHA